MTGSSKKAELKSKQKLEKKLSFYTKVKDAVTSLNAKKSISKKQKQSHRQKKQKAYDLSALSEFLPEPAAPEQEQKTEVKPNCKSRQTLVLQEAARLKAVLNNPQFQLDPFTTIHKHLLATQPPAAAKDEAAKHRKDSKDKKRRKKSASSSSQAMDV